MKGFFRIQMYKSHELPLNGRERKENFLSDNIFISKPEKCIKVCDDVYKYNI